MSDIAASADGEKAEKRPPTRAWQRWFDGGRLLTPLGRGGFRRSWSEGQRRRRIVELARHPRWLQDNLKSIGSEAAEELRPYWDVFAENLLDIRAFAEALGPQVEFFARILGAGAAAFARGLFDPVEWALGLDAEAWARGLGPNSGDWARGLRRRIEPYTRALGHGNPRFLGQLGPHCKSWVRGLGDRVEDWARGLGPIAAELPPRVWSPFEFGGAFHGQAAGLARGLGRHAPAWAEGLGDNAFSFFLGLEAEGGSLAAFLEGCGDKRAEFIESLGNNIITLDFLFGEANQLLCEEANRLRSVGPLDLPAFCRTWSRGLGGLAGPVGRAASRNPARFVGRLGEGLKAFAEGLDESAVSRFAVGLRERARVFAQAIAPFAERWARGLGDKSGLFIYGLRNQAGEFALGLDSALPGFASSITDQRRFAETMAEASGDWGRGLGAMAEDVGAALGPEAKNFVAGLGEHLDLWVKGLGPKLGPLLQGLGAHRRECLEACRDRAEAFASGMRDELEEGLRALGPSTLELAQVFGPVIREFLTGLRSDRAIFLAALGPRLATFVAGLEPEAKPVFADAVKEEALVLGLMAGLDSQRFTRSLGDSAAEFLAALGGHLPQFAAGFDEKEVLKLSLALERERRGRATSQAILRAYGSERPISTTSLIEAVSARPELMGRALRPRAARLGGIFARGMRGFRSAAGPAFYKFLWALGGETGHIFAAMSDRSLGNCVEGLADRAQDLGSALARDAEGFGVAIGAKIEVFFHALQRSVAEFSRGIGEHSEALGLGLKSHAEAAARGLRGNAFHFAHGLGEFCVGFERGLGEEALLDFRRGLGDGGTDYWLVASSRASRRQRHRRDFSPPRIHIRDDDDSGRRALSVRGGDARVFKILNVKTGSPVRCILCHCEAIDNEDFLRCASCRILAHEDCLTEMAEGQCPNDGTAAREFTAVRVQYELRKSLKIRAVERPPAEGQGEGPRFGEARNGAP